LNKNAQVIADKEEEVLIFSICRGKEEEIYLYIRA